VHIRKRIIEEKQENINLINSYYSDFNLWWENLWGAKKGTELGQKKEGIK